MAFHYHFKDIYDLVEWCCEEDGKRLLAGKGLMTLGKKGFLQILIGYWITRCFV